MLFDDVMAVSIEFVCYSCYRRCGVSVSFMMNIDAEAGDSQTLLVVSGMYLPMSVCVHSLASLRGCCISFGWGKGGKVTSAGWQVILCDPIWHVIYHSGEVIWMAYCYIQFSQLIWSSAEMCGLVNVDPQNISDPQTDSRSCCGGGLMRIMFLLIIFFVTRHSYLRDTK